MGTEFIPFAQMTTAQKREHLVKAHGYSEREVKLADLNGPLSRSHTDDHRMYDGTAAILPHAHTKVSRRTKR